MRVVIVGASGNVGTALLRRLRADGHELVGVARRPPSDGPFVRGVDWHSVDLTGPGAWAGLRRAMADADSVVHLAWGFQPSHRTDYLRALDVGGTRASLDAAATEGVAHFVHFSSVGAYSPAAHARPVDETWPTGGIPQLPYSRHKAAVERLLDEEEARMPPRLAITRIRPALVGHRASGGGLLRYTTPAWVPTATLRWLPVVPLDRGFHAQFVHVDDVAEAVARVVASRATGAFNLAGNGEVRAEDIARALGARHVHLPWRWLRAAAALTWRARLQPVDPGWLDLAAEVPRMSTERARTELDWSPQHDALSALAEAVDGARTGAGGDTPALRPRRWLSTVVDTARRGLASYRRVP